jgi:hypothetical protein
VRASRTRARFGTVKHQREDVDRVGLELLVGFRRCIRIKQLVNALFSRRRFDERDTRGKAPHNKNKERKDMRLPVVGVRIPISLALSHVSFSLSLSLSLSDHLLNSAAPMRYTEIPIQYPPDEVKVPESSPALSEQEILKPTIL